MLTLPLRHFAHIRMYCTFVISPACFTCSAHLESGPGDSSVGIATHYGLDGSRGSGFPYLSRTALGRYSAVGVVFTTHPYLAAVLKKEYTYISPQPLCLQSLVCGELNLTLPAHLFNTSREFLLRRGEGSTCSFIVNTHRVQYTQVSKRDA